MLHDDPAAGGSGRVHLSMQVREGGVAWLSIGRPEAGAVFLGLSGLEGLNRCLTELEPLIAEHQVQALVVSGERPGMFCAGTDIDELRALPDAVTAAEWSRSGQAILRRLEELPIPTIAAIDGPCLEAGLELALACSYRLASDSPSTRLGLPQVRLGLIPTFGGTARLPRLIGLQASLELILTGNAIEPTRALQLGMVDEILPVRRFWSAVEDFADARIRTRRIGTGARRPIPRRLLEDTAPGRRLIFRNAARKLGHPLEHGPPVLERALRTVSEGLSLPLAGALNREAEVAGDLIASDHARALLHALRLLQDARRGPSASLDIEVQRVGVLGAGAVGSEIAFLLASAYLPVLLKDQRRDALHRGVQHVRSRLARAEKEGALATGDTDLRRDLVSPASGFGGFGTLDVLLAAVNQEAEKTEEAFREVEEHTRPDCVLACCSLTIAPTRLQQGMAYPQRVVGLRFSRPTELFPLLEIVPGKATDQRTIDTCLVLARRLGRAAIVAPDLGGTPGSRLIAACFAEALRLLEEGASVVEIDRAMETFGFVLGPFRRMDAMGVARSVRLLEHLADSCGRRMQPSGIVRRLSGSPALFYRYVKGEPRSPNPGLPAGIPAPRNGFSEPILNRVLFSLINEAALTLQEQGSLRPRDLDLASIAGLGFPRSHGGVLYYADRVGTDRLVRLMSEYAERFGQRFAPAPLLQETAAEKRGFHGAATGQRVPGVLR